MAYKIKTSDDKFKVGDGKLTVDSDGNVGIGVTPSNWDTNYNVLQVDTAASFWGGGTAGATFSSQGANYVYNAGYTYYSSNYASDYYQYNGEHYFATAASGTAGNAITWDYPLYISAGGEVGIGTLSPGSYYSTNLVVSCPNGGGITMLAESTSNSNYLMFADGTGSSAYEGQINFDHSINRMQIASVQGDIFFYSHGQNGVQIEYDNLYAGLNNSNGWLGLTGELSGYAASTYPTLKTNGTHIYFDANGTYTGYIGYDTGFTDVSDAREKENIVTIDNALDKVSQLRGVYHTWKDNRDEGRRNTGVIAQEVMEVMPEVVSEGAERYGVAYGKLVGVLIEAVKELKTKNEELEARVVALESASSLDSA